MEKFLVVTNDSWRCVNEWLEKDWVIKSITTEVSREQHPYHKVWAFIVLQKD